MVMQGARSWLTGAAMALAMGASAPAALAEAPESDETIKLGVNEWTTQQVITRVAHQLLEEMGYNVESVTVGYYPQVEAMVQNDITATLELWPNNIGEGVYEALDNGELVHLGNHEIEGGGQYYYPVYMEEQCPGLPDYNALKDCIDLFVAPDTAPSGRFVGYPADWGNTFYEERFEALGLDLVPIAAGGEGALIAEMKSAWEREAPLLIHFWTPHWVFSEYDYRVLEMPLDESITYENCFNDPAWGPNPDMTHDCGQAPQKGIFKAANPGIDETWPAAAELLRQLSFTNEDATWMLVEVDQGGLSQDEAAAKWIEQNRDKVNGWMDAAAGS